MISIADACADIQRHPAPVIFVDTCSLLDLFRRDDKSHQPRVRPQEIWAAVDLLSYVCADPKRVRLVVPELIPREFRDHADSIEEGFEAWIKFHDDNHDWVIGAASCFLNPVPFPVLLVQSIGLPAKLRNLANELLAGAIILDRDQGCLDRAVTRLIMKQRPSHKKEMKDSMNMEQCLELSRQLQTSGFAYWRVFVSSNTNDFAETSSSKLHPDLDGVFAAVGLDYFTSFDAAIGHLRADGQVP